MVYVCMSMPSWAVTTTVMVLGPVTSDSAAEEVPWKLRRRPFTVTVAFGSAVVGVMVIDETPLPTDAV